MMINPVVEAFIEQSAVSIMFRGMLENIFGSQRLDGIFKRTAVRQYEGDLLFSTCANLLSLVVLKSQKSVNAAYQVKLQEMTVSVKSLYDKLKRIEPNVSERMVDETALDLAQVIDELKASVPGPLPGYDVRIVDGNHLAGTDHRLAELRKFGAAALPGQAMAVLDPQRQLVVNVVTCEDGHASERTLIPRILQLVEKGQCWIEDRLFCTLDFIFGIQERDAFFLLRQHGQLTGELQGERKQIGPCSTGVLYEQPLLVKRKNGMATTIRRLTIVRQKPTAKGESEVHLLTNLPSQISAVEAAEAYLGRWTIENAFRDLATTLRSEINTLGYPKAALLGFCLGLLMFNAISVVKAALRMGADAGEETQALRKNARKLSTYYLADEISGVWRGMHIAIPANYWPDQFANLSPIQLAEKLKWLASRVYIRRFYTNPWKPKRPQPKRISGNRGNHVATHRILQQRKRSAGSAGPSTQ